MDWSIWGTKLAGSLRSLAVRLAKLMISESGSAGQAQGRSGSIQAASENATRTGGEWNEKRRPGTSRVPGEGVPVALAVHLDVDAYRHEVVPRRPAARRRQRGTNQPPAPSFPHSNRSKASL